MPHLQFFIPCDKVIINKEDDDLSIIGVLDGLLVESQDNQPVSDEKPVRLPRSWYTVAQWHKEVGDEEVAFQQRVQIVLPNGKLSGRSVSSRHYLHDQKAIFATKGTAIPFIGSGTYRFRLSFRVGDYEEEEIGWKIAAEYLFTIITDSSNEETESV